MTQYKYTLEEKDMPTQWYNIVADMKEPPPPYRHPARWTFWAPTIWRRSFPRR
jgi:predicted alternative tryptophan synthase beta-subunit